MDNRQECNHVFKYGYTMDLVVYCVKCKKDVDDIYLGIKFSDAEKLITNEENMGDYE